MGNTMQVCRKCGAGFESSRTGSTVNCPTCRQKPAVIPGSPTHRAIDRRQIGYADGLNGRPRKVTGFRSYHDAYDRGVAERDRQSTIDAEAASPNAFELMRQTNQVVDSIRQAADALGMRRVDVLRVVAGRMGEHLAEPTTADQLRQAAADLGIDLQDERI